MKHSEQSESTQRLRSPVTPSSAAKPIIRSKKRLRGFVAKMSAFSRSVSMSTR